VKKKVKCDESNTNVFILAKPENHYGKNILMNILIIVTYLLKVLILEIIFFKRICIHSN